MQEAQPTESKGLKLPPEAPAGESLLRIRVATYVRLVNGGGR